MPNPSSREEFSAVFLGLLDTAVAVPRLQGNFALLTRESDASNQAQTNDVFSEKWGKYGESDEKERLYAMQRRWYLDLYGFADEAALRDFLRARPVILDAGCGLG